MTSVRTESRGGVKGVVASLRVELYETGKRCCRTSARTPARRRAGSGCCEPRKAQLEPIFLLYDGHPVVAVPRS